jgi:TPP-dependent pyruvate/acetoin dehydrogenase alpha subunit
MSINLNNRKEDKELINRLFRSLYKIRRVELEVARVYPSDVIKSPVHLSVGQEFISVAICDILKKSDIVFGTYRGHALYLAKGGNLNAMMAELYGKVDGCCRGKGGSMHLADKSVNMMGTSAIVATSIPEAVGYALAIQYRADKEVVICFFGDGATSEGAFHESLNFASLKKLPILFVCENNDYAIHARLSDRAAQMDLYKLAESHHIPAQIVKESDIFTLRNVANSMVTEVRSGSGPQFLEAHAYRWLEHVGPEDDWNLGYRSEQEIIKWEKDDQVEVLGSLLSKKLRLQIEKEINNEVKKSMIFAHQSPFPSKEELSKHVYK